MVAFFVSLVCSSFVASAAVVLRPRQRANEVREVRENIVDVAGLMNSEANVDELFSHIEPRVIEFESGRYLDDIDPADFDARREAKDPKLGVEIPPERDLARIGRRAKRGLVYLVRQDGEVDRIILPVSGYGLWSTLHGFLALESDGNTVADIVFYAHGETAGIGDFVSKPSWRSLWPGKRAYDAEGQLELEIIKGRVAPDDPMRDYHVDGVSGATLTGNGVTNLLRYWLGEDGYGPFLARIRGEGS